MRDDIYLKKPIFFVEPKDYSKYLNDELKCDLRNVLRKNKLSEYVDFTYVRDNSSKDKRMDYNAVWRRKIARAEQRKIEAFE